jgi:signal transduction histidine kinase
MKYAKWFLHPIFIFVFSIAALGVSLFLYIYWYVEASTKLQSVIEKTNLDAAHFFELRTWVVIVVLSILVAIILTGIFIIFSYHLKSFRLYRLQHNFINSFTHELKTPVTSLQLYLETFAKHSLPREMQLKYINYMLDDVKRLTANINKILDIAKIESRTFMGQWIAVDLVTFINDFCNRNQQLFRDCHIALHNPGGRSIPYEIDQALFEMLLMNILSNAVKYNKSEKKKVEIFFKHRKGKVLISFIDNGIGLEKRETKKIFKKFYQVGSAGSGQDEGSGLGLYLVDGIARLHKGRVIAESRGLGKGTSFTVILPLLSAKGSGGAG